MIRRLFPRVATSIRLAALAAFSLAIFPAAASAQGPLTNGGNHAGAISTPGEIDEWTFTANINEPILLSIGEVLPAGTDPDFRPWIRLRRPDGVEIGSDAGLLVATINVNAPLTGTYTLLVRDYTVNRPGTSLGSYILHFVKVPFTGGAIPAGDDGGSLTNAGANPGRIGAPGVDPRQQRGDLDVWTFDAAQNQYIALSIGERLEIETDPDFRPWIRLYGPTGAFIAQDSGLWAASINVAAPLSGTYTVVVADYNVNREGAQVGDYILHLVRAPGPYDHSDDGGPLTNGGNHRGRIGAPGDRPRLHLGDLDVWTFDATQNQYIALSIGERLEIETDPDFRPWIRLYGPTGAFIAQDSGLWAASINVAAPLSGTYTVVVADYIVNREGSHTGDYTLHLVRAPGPYSVPDGDDGGPLTNGGNHRGRIGAPGDRPRLQLGDLDVWTFDAAQNQYIALSIGERLEIETDPDFRPWIRLYGPTGAFIAQDSGLWAASINLTAPLSGTYTVVVADYIVNREGSHVGDYTLHLVRAPGPYSVPDGDDGGPLTNGGNHRGRIGAPGDRPRLQLGDLDVWTFDAAQNQYIALSIGERLEIETDPDFRPWIRLYGPTGAFIAQDSGLWAASINVAAPLSGTYTVVVADYIVNREGSHTGDYTLHFVRVPGEYSVADGDDGGPLLNGVNRTGRIGAPGASPLLQRGDLDVWTFCAAQGTALTVNMSEIVPGPPDPDFRPWIRLYRPDGTFIAQDSALVNASINVTAPLSGLFTVIAADYIVNREGSHIGDYTISASGIVACPSGPTTVSDAYSSIANSTLTIPAPGVLANDLTNGGGPMTAELTSAVTIGTLALNANGSFTFVPPAGFTGTASFSYRAVNAFGAGNTATVTLTVTQGPTTVADSYTTALNTPLTIAAPGVLANDNSNGGGALTAQLVTTVTSGALGLNPNGSFTFSPPAGFTGPASFTYRAVNSVGAGNVATVTITVAAGVPTTVGDAFSTSGGTPLTVAAPGVLGNDASNGGGALSAQLVTTTANGILALAADGGLSYSPNAGFSGADTFTYRAVNSVGSGNAATVTINVAASGPQPPTELYAASITGNTLTLRFKAPAAGTPPTGYLLEGGLVPGSPVAQVPTGSIDLIYTLLAPTGSFYVRMRTMAGAALSEPSNEILVHVNVPRPPSAPASLTGMANGSSIALAWRNTFGGGAPGGVILDVTGDLSASLPLGLTESFEFAGVPGGTYTLSVRAANTAGTSPSSNAITLQFPSPDCSGVPSPPSNFLAYRIGRAIHVLWDPASTGHAPTAFVLNVTGTFGGSFAMPGRGLSGMVGPGTYHLSVAAHNACGGSAATAVQTVVVP